jgi:16S rRNA A1518/A1519 N6-dimethyltransferase RsmA/KsgA/DIM1 with predicted DNA glycosylase/AP lyase activity
LRPHGRFSPDIADIYFQLIDDLFLARRKKISNNLTSGKIAEEGGVEVMTEALESSGISGDRRAETLSVADIELLSRMVKNLK